MKYKLLKELPFMKVGTVFERQCKNGTDCCVFGMSFHNCVKHYDAIRFSETENTILCSIIDNPDWIMERVEQLPVDFTAREAIEQYDAGLCSHEQLIRFIEEY